MQAEGFLIEEATSACYELVMKFVLCMSDHLQVLDKERYVVLYDNSLFFCYPLSRILKISVFSKDLGTY